MAGLSAGALDRRVALLRPVAVKNDFNETVTVWSPLAQVWGSKRDLSDGERIRAEQLGSKITTRFQIRWSRAVSVIDPTWQVECEDRRYQVVAAKELGRREGLELTATALGETP